tara:strand:+ start:212 stop:763 length:552 start_codon:yes stop_codon:yes gene_type:complete
MSDLKVNEIKTDTIKNQAGTSAATIDSTGRILQPAVPAFSATTHHASSADYMSGHITFDTITLNRGNCWDGNKFLAPVAGVYQFNMCGFASGPSGGLINVDYKGYLQKSQQSDFSDVSGSTGHLAQTYAYLGSSISGYLTITMAATVELAANDYVRYFVAAAALYRNTASQRYSPVFSGFLVG